MMKKGFFIGKGFLSSVFIVVTMLSGCTYRPPDSISAADLKPIQFSEVVIAEGKSKDQLYSTALAWFGNTYRSAKAVFDIQDKDAGHLIAKPLFQYEPSVLEGSARTRGVVRYSVTIDVKDGRYRYVVDNFVHEGSTGFYQGMTFAPLSFGLLTYSEFCPYPMELTPSTVQTEWKELKKHAIDEATLLIADLKKNMVQPAHKADW